MKPNGTHNHPWDGSLYLIKLIIQKLEGHIRYEASKLGSNVILTLPIEAY